jgi:hypothetical protein
MVNMEYNQIRLFIKHRKYFMKLCGKSIKVFPKFAGSGLERPLDLWFDGKIYMKNSG